jgi:hypothetical protein
VDIVWAGLAHRSRFLARWCGDRAIGANWRGDRPAARPHDRRQELQAVSGDTVLAAALAHGRVLRQFEFDATFRAGFCLMGACQDCWMWTESGGRLRACPTTGRRRHEAAHFSAGGPVAMTVLIVGAGPAGIAAAGLLELIASETGAPLADVGHLRAHGPVKPISLAIVDAG